MNERFTPRARKVCELALREALSLGHNYVGTEHLLLGLLRENEGIAARILERNGVDRESVTKTMLEIYSLGGRCPTCGTDLKH